MIELYVVLIGMLAAAVLAIEVKDLLAAAVAMGMVGFSVAIVFILVQAPDLAMVQIVVEILTVVLFAAVILRTTHVDSTVQLRVTSRMIFPAVMFGGFVMMFLVLLAHVLPELPKFGQPLMRVAASYIELGLGRTGAANLVAAIILDFRAWDTLGEVVVLFTAVVGVLTVVRQFGRKADRPSRAGGDQ
ncbi:MAG: hydrogen gas-evolving membrane-bound hydrogenase subunit E [bacterium]